MIDFQAEEQEFRKITDAFVSDINSIRTGRASTSLVENILVESYGSQMPMAHVATISTPDARSIMIKPWDKSALPAIESAIQKSNLGLSIISESDQVRLSLPPLTEERRKEFVKLVGKKMEEAKISIRQKRDDIWKTIQEEERAKIISESQKFSQKEKMEKIVSDLNKKIESVAEKKEKELMEV